MACALFRLVGLIVAGARLGVVGARFAVVLWFFARYRGAYEVDTF